MAVQTGDLKAFVSTMETEMKRLGAPSVREKEAFLAYQADQVARLMGLEGSWRDLLAKHPRGPEVYERFMDYVYTLPSVLSARSYFRERQEAFEGVLGQALQDRDWAKFAAYRVNFRFVSWAMGLRMLPGYFGALAKRIERLRGEMVLLLMPLAISRARIFWGRTPASHLTLPDLAQIAFEGLMTAVDKYVPDPVTGFSSVYRAVAIGRVTGNLIELYSQTLVHFFPRDRKILYRANKMVGRMAPRGSGVDFERMADQLNAGAVAEVTEEGQQVRPVAFQTNGDEVAGLMAASSHVSADAVVGGARKLVSKMVAPEELSPDRQAEHGEALTKMREATRHLSVLQRKMLALKGMIEPEDV